MSEEKYLEEMARFATEDLILTLCDYTETNPCLCEYSSPCWPCRITYKLNHWHAADKSLRELKGD